MHTDFFLLSDMPYNKLEVASQIVPVITFPVNDELSRFHLKNRDVCSQS